MSPPRSLLLLFTLLPLWSCVIEQSMDTTEVESTSDIAAAGSNAIEEPVEEDEEPVVTIDVPERPTWDVEVEDLIYDHCAQCHQPTVRSGGLDLTSYAETVMNAESIEERLRLHHDDHGSMPPNQPRPFAEAAIFLRWFEVGAPESP